MECIRIFRFPEKLPEGVQPPLDEQLKTISDNDSKVCHGFVLLLNDASVSATSCLLVSIISSNSSGVRVSAVAFRLGLTAFIS